MKKILRYVLFAAVWCSVAGYIVWATSVAERQRAARTVRKVEIEIVDSTAQGYLVSRPMVREWIRRSGIRTIGTAVDKVDLPGLESMIAQNGFVSHVAAYMSYDGVLRLEISQRNPLVRLLTDGINAYVTSDGYVFNAPRSSSLYVPVVTGSYRPPFAAAYQGEVLKSLSIDIQRVDERVAALEREKYPLYRRELDNDRNILALRRMRVKRQWWRLESGTSFEKRIEKLKKQKVDLRQRYRYEARQIQHGIDKIAGRQQAERVKQKKLEKNYEDFMKLLTFVKFVEADDFWRSEIVQIMAHTAPSGALELSLVPRSGSYTIFFGRMEHVERKFAKLLSFYRSGLSSLGWDKYEIIDIRYNDQVVCKR